MPTVEVLRPLGGCASGARAARARGGRGGRGFRTGLLYTRPVYHTDSRMQNCAKQARARQIALRETRKTSAKLARNWRETVEANTQSPPLFKT
jgi:hypothetical protein